jgi:Flp pilus assembly protein TadG
MNMRSAQGRYQNAFFVATRRLRPKNNRRGATAVEFAVVAPVFFALLFGLVEFGRMTMVKQALSNAASAGCRTACLASTQSASQAEGAAREHLRTFMSAANDAGVCRISVEPADLSEIERGNEVTVNVEVNFSDVSWIPTGYLESSILRTEATMKRE